jgi:hypothetical protein
MNILPTVWMAVLFATAVPGFTPKARMQAKGFSSLPEEDKTVHDADPRVEKALKKLGLKYKVNEDGDFKLVFAIEDNRTQVVIISSTTETLGKMEIREVWSPIAKFASNPPCDLSLELLEKHGKAQKRLILISFHRSSFCGGPCGGAWFYCEGSG